MDDSSLVMLYSLARVAFCFGVILVAARRHWPLETGLGFAGLGLALLSGITPWAWFDIVATTLTGQSFWTVACSLFVILLLSGVMASAGQTQRMVQSVERRISSRKAQLFLFPAFIGFFPVPGGAIFSCPMVEASARNLALSNDDKTMLNYWFRHVWELSWPLYPGLILYVGLADISLFTAVLHNWPACVAAIVGGWFLLLRHCPIEPQKSSSLPAETLPDSSSDKSSGNVSGRSPESTPETPASGSILWEALPLCTGIVGAFVAMKLVPQVAAGFLFSLAFCVGLVVCLVQNRLSPLALWPLVKSPKTRSTLLIVATIFIFKDVIQQSDVLDVFNRLARNQYALFVLCTVLPLLSGMLTGLMVAFVGVAFPIITTMLQQGGMWDERLPWLTLAIMFGNIGQMLSPMHVCLVVTCRFFDSTLLNILRRLFVPCLVLAGTAIVWFFVLRAFS